MEAKTGKFKHKKKIFLQIYENQSGNISDACKAAGIGRATFYRWLEKYPTFQRAIWEVDESQLDKSESKLKEARDKGEAWAVCFHLKTKGKKRGYIEGREVHAEVNAGGLEIRIIEEAD